MIIVLALTRAPYTTHPQEILKLDWKNAASGLFNDVSLVNAS